MIYIEDMSKWDIKNGMVVELKNSTRGIIIGDKIFCPSDIINLITCSFSLDDFNDNLSHKFTEELDIVKIYIIRKTDKITLADVIRGVSSVELVWEKNGRYKDEEGIIELMKTLSREEMKNIYQFSGNCNVRDIPEYILKAIDAIIDCDCPEEWNLKEPDTPNDECLRTCTECWYRSLNGITNK